MTHMVTYRSGEGQPVYHPTESLEEAARHVEQLRNAGQGADARIFRLEEVPMEVKTYYKVELPGMEASPSPSGAKAEAAPAAVADAGPPAAAAAAVAVEPPAAPVSAPAASASPAAATPPPAASGKPEPATAGANGTGGRFGLFGKG